MAPDPDQDPQNAADWDAEQPDQNPEIGADDAWDEGVDSGEAGGDDAASTPPIEDEAVDAPAAEGGDEEPGEAEAPGEKKKRGFAKLFHPSQWDASLYTVLLAVSLVCISLSCLLLLFELQQFGGYPWWSTIEAVPRTSG